MLTFNFAGTEIALLKDIAMDKSKRSLSLALPKNNLYVVTFSQREPDELKKEGIHAPHKY